MREFPVNRLRATIAAGQVGVIANGPNTPDLCDFLGQFGFDGAFVDLEHGGHDWGELADAGRACELWGMTCVVRVNRLDEAQILRALDLGAAAVMVPHVVDVEDARRAARACRYPPAGVRGVAGSRRAYGVDDYFRRADAEVQCIALIEDAEAVENIDALLAVEGIDVWYVAPSDLAASLGHVGAPEHAAVQRALARALESIVAAGQVAGTLVHDGNVERFLDMGVRCVGVPWPAWVARGARGFLERVRGRG
ncbi:MAG: 4-hydroxy-2-oxo-heptane-1,7-dioate aldolase [Ectothiorhodospiraceae bacterium]|nr:4-hydroxy-2-oxo-heptane-1,7-dioate aldolase [Chromatiales bacterium]MCP5155987.1 4-hydroxy-2-oxo-heptane-1,7-dioate aldolase [Ectothiorhodospiraceae bacterium]